MVDGDVSVTEASDGFGMTLSETCASAPASHSRVRQQTLAAL